MIQLLKRSTNSAGGIFYHYLALKYRNRLWRPFIEKLSVPLLNWNPRSRKLILVGPSGGYCVPSTFFERFDEVYAIDPDPFAKWIFGRRHRDVPSLKWDYGDYFSPEKGRFDISKFRSFIEKQGDAAILFSNFLGQIGCRYFESVSGDSFRKWGEELVGLLEDRSWLSFHDRLSGTAEPNLEEVRESPYLDNEQLAGKFYRSRKNSVELVDHFTESFFLGADRISDPQYFSWELLPGQHHLIELVSSSSGLKNSNDSQAGKLR